MAFDTVSISSDDDVPLSEAAGASYVPIKSATLKTRSLQHCDFCEEVFLNKYDALVHNAKHIIIPLIKRELHQCPLCLFYFTSRYKLKHHTRNKHKDITQTNGNVTVINKDKEHIEKSNATIVNDKCRQNYEKPNVKLVNKSKLTFEKKTVNPDDDKSKKTYEKPIVKLNNEIPKHNNDKTIESKQKIVTHYESDDEDDLPLVLNGYSKETDAIKETEQVAAKRDTSALREALLKDVKVVIEKIELTPEKIKPKLSGNQIEVPEKHELKVTVNQVPDKAEKMKVNQVPDKAEKMKVNQVPDKAETTSASNAAKAPAQIETNTKNPGNAPKISSRLRFEDDIVDFCDDAVMQDLTTECIVDMNLFDEPWFDELAKSITGDDIVNDDVISIDDDDEPSVAKGESGETSLLKDMLLNGVKEEAVEVYAPSTPYDELIKPGVYRCRKCQQMFPTRFNQIQHEMQHMRIRKPRPFLCEHCDRFMANKKALKDHMASKHMAQYKLRTYSHCQKCNLKYNNYQKHLENYHNLLRCHLCNKGFEAEIDRLNHIRGHLVKIKCGQCDFVASELEIQEHQKRFHKAVSSSTNSFLKLCDVCCLFLKNKPNTQYVFGEAVSELGARLYCDHCGNKFFHLTQVRKTLRGRQTDRFQFEKEREKKKGLTNQERLKNIQHRLKMINKLSRF